MNNKTRQILIHILCCIGFLSIPVIFTSDSFNLSSFTIRDLVGYSLIVLFFYFNYYYLIPNYYLRKRYLAFFLFIVGSYVVIAMIPSVLVPFRPPAQMPNFGPGGDTAIGHGGPGFPRGGGSHDFPHGSGPRHGRHPLFWFREIDRNMFRFLLVVAVSLLLKISEQWKKARQQRVAAELSYLKAQVNPHFLFNTLNTIYSLAIERSDNTPKAIVELSGMMRYVLSDASADYVSLDKEVDYIKSYITLQEYRFDKTVTVTFNVQGDTAGKRIAPLLLIPFIENAFKHGINPEEYSAISITIDINDNKLKMQVVNNKVHVKTQHEETRVGIENVKNRLNLLYRGMHELHIADSGKTFTATLSLQLK